MRLDDVPVPRRVENQPPGSMKRGVWGRVRDARTLAFSVDLVLVLHIGTPAQTFGRTALAPHNHGFASPFSSSRRGRYHGLEDVGRGIEFRCAR